MTLKQKFDNVEIMFENQLGQLRYDELLEASNECVKIAEDFAIGFNDWVNVNAYKFPTKTTTKELLEIYKKEKGL
jgi:hypothetical protein